MPMGFAGEADHFALRVSGDSMIGAGIFDGDIVIVRSTKRADDGDIVAVLLPGPAEDEATIKRLRRRDGRVMLVPENPALEPFEMTDGQVAGQGRLGPAQALSRSPIAWHKLPFVHRPTEETACRPSPAPRTSSVRSDRSRRSSSGSSPRRRPGGRCTRRPRGCTARDGSGSSAPAPASTRPRSAPACSRRRAAPPTPCSSMQFVRWAPIVGPQDGVVIISHTAETAYARSAHALAFEAGLSAIMITKRGAGFSNMVETVDKETSETYTVSYTTAVLVLAMIAKELGADSITEEGLAAVPEAVAAALGRPRHRRHPHAEAAARLHGRRSTSITAREGALKVREAARFLAEGYDAEYLLHGSAVPLTGDDRLVALTPPDSDGFMTRSRRRPRVRACR